MRFFEVAQNVSREDVQDILAKILSGEIQKPGSYSFQTLEFLKYLSQKDLEVFLKFVAISTEVGVMKLSASGKESLEKYDLNFSAYTYLASLGLFNHSSTISYDVDLSLSSPKIVNIGKNSLLVSYEVANQVKKFDFGLFVFSNVGVELRQILIDKASNKNSEGYISDFIDEAQKKGFRISRVNK
jgi:hypothetical protein